MNSERMQRLFRQLLEHDRAGSREMAPATGEVAVTRYTDPDFFQREMRTLFRHYPLAVCHSSEIATGGACMTHDWLGVPMILTRDAQGQVHALLNQCSHRSTRLLDAAEPCSRRSLVCPYHNWVYGLDGGLRRIPDPEGFPTAGERTLDLTALPCAERGGLVFVVPGGGDVFDVDDWAGPLAAELDAFGVGTSVFFRRSAVHRKANWKLVMDAFLESYHIKRLHKDTLARFFRDNLAIIEREGRHLFAMVGREALGEARPDQPDQWDARYHATCSLYFLPNTILIFHPDYTSIINLYPVAPDESVFCHTMLVPHEPADERERAHWNRSFELIDGGVFQAEDYYVAEQMQRGMRCGARDSLLVGRYEQPILEFHAIMDELMAAAEARAVDPARPTG